MDKWLKDLGAWKDYGLILVAICLFTGILPVMAVIKWGLLAWIAANLWHRWNAQDNTMRDITKNRWKKFFYVVVVIFAFWLGHQYGEEAAKVIEDVPVPKIVFESEPEIEVPEVSADEVRG